MTSQRGDRPQRAAIVAVRVPAKMNIVLSVGPLRRDGFHDLATVFHAVSLYDEVVATAADTITVSVEGLDAELVPLDGSNLAVRAARLLAERAGIRVGVHLAVRKDIPVAGGMAGGSADAAAALVACDALWGAGLTSADLQTLAAELGSDVPFALLGGTAIGSGRGEHLRPIPVTGRLHWVVAIAAGGLSTPGVYRALDRQRRAHRMPAPAVPEAAVAALENGDVVALGKALRNDLQPAAVALEPGLSTTLDAGKRMGALGGLVSGSGPTCVFLAADGDHAATMAEDMSRTGGCRHVRVVTGPVPGARVVA